PVAGGWRVLALGAMDQRLALRQFPRRPGQDVVTRLVLFLRDRPGPCIMSATLRSGILLGHPRFRPGETMRRLRRSLPLLTVLVLLLPLAAPAAIPSGDFRPDPKSVQGYGPAYRYPQAGWIVLHIEGEPYERGYQHGRLLAPEIAAAIRGAAIFLNHKAPTEGWSQTRSLVNALFARRY